MDVILKFDLFHSTEKIGAELDTMSGLVSPAKPLSSFSSDVFVESLDAKVSVPVWGDECNLFYLDPSEISLFVGKVSTARPGEAFYGESSTPSPKTSLECTTGGHNKEYHLGVYDRGGSFEVMAWYGGIGKTLKKISKGSFSTKAEASKEFTNIKVDKMRKGYEESWDS